MLMRSLSAGFAGLALVLSVPLSAQERAVPPADVAITGVGTTATIKWSAVPIDGVMYRVLRSTDSRRAGVDITDPTREIEVVDPRVEAGITYFYQVIAVFRDATTAAAAVVAYTAPSAVIAPPPAPPPAPLAAITEVAPVRTAMPTAVTGVVVEGTTTASATVSWQPVTGATSYSIKRSYATSSGTSSTTPVTGLTTTSWIDRGPLNAGFPIAATYIYDVTAATPFGSVTGQGAWKRPNPSCDAPASTQQPLAILEPTKLITFGPLLPVGPTVIWEDGWSIGRQAIAIRADRSVQGSGTWTFAGSSCDGTIPPGPKAIAFIDRIKGVAPNTTYLYRFTAFAANGDVGIGSVPWTSPNRSAIHWLSATSNGNTVTLSFRYEPPLTNPPTEPSDRFRVTAPYGLDQIVNGCGKLAGCTVVLTGVPSGTHEFKGIAEWKNSLGTFWTIWSPTTVVVP